MTELAGPGTVRCPIAFEESLAPVPFGGNRLTSRVVTARECTWTASADASWIQVSPVSGQGEALLTVAVAGNQRPSSRAGAVIVNDQRLAVAQEAAPCRYDLSSTAATVGFAGGEARVEVSAMSGCSWTASGGAAWVRALTTAGDGDGTVVMEVDSNPGLQRSAELRVAESTFTVTQAAAPPGPAPAPAPSPSPPSPAPPSPPPPPPSSPCTYSLAPDWGNFDEEGGYGTFRVDTQPGCAWEASTEDNWVRIVSAAGGMGNGEVKYQVTSRSSGRSRLGGISVADQRHGVWQEVDGQ